MSYPDQQHVGGINRDDTSETGDDTAQIRAGIEQTRGEMGETIEAIQARLNPDHLKDQVKEQVREQFQEVKATVREATIGKAEDMVRNVGDTVTEARYTLAETISHNPIPAAMVALGLGWLWMNRRSGAPRRPMAYSAQDRYRSSQIYSEGARYYDSGAGYAAGQGSYGGSGMLEQGQRAVGNTVHHVQDTASQVASRAQETVGNVVNRAQETASDVTNRAQETVGNIVNQAQETAGNIADQAQYQVQRVEDRFQQTLRENPLAVGAVAFALGTAVGFAVPETRREHELMGAARDNLVDKVQNAVQDTMEKVQQVAGEVMEDVQATTQEAAKERGLVGQ